MQGVGISLQPKGCGTPLQDPSPGSCTSRLDTPFENTRGVRKYEVGCENMRSGVNIRGRGAEIEAGMGTKAINEANMGQVR